MEQLLQDIARLQDALSQYEQLDKQRAQAKAAREALEEKTAALEQARVQAQATEQTCKSARAQLAEQPKLAVAAEQTAQEQKAAEQRCKALTELDRQRKRCAELQEKLEAAQEKYTRAAEAAQAALAHYSACLLYTSFLPVSASRKRKACTSENIFLLQPRIASLDSRLSICWVRISRWIRV